MGLSSTAIVRRSSSTPHRNMEREAIDRNKIVGVLFIDLKKVFDSISNEVLLKKFAATGLSGNTYELLIDYLSGRS